MASEINLRAVPAAGGKDRPPERLRGDPGRTGLWLVITIILGVSLALALGWQNWTRIELSERIVLLEEETRSQRATIAARDRVLGVHKARLDDVRDHVEGLRVLLAQPIE